MIDYAGIVRQMNGAAPTGAIDLSCAIEEDIFREVGDRLRAEGKLHPFRDRQLIYDRDGVPMGMLERQEDGSWMGSLRFGDRWFPVYRQADDAPVIVEASEEELMDARYAEGHDDRIR